MRRDKAVAAGFLAVLCAASIAIGFVIGRYSAPTTTSGMFPIQPDPETMANMLQAPLQLTNRQVEEITLIFAWLESGIRECGIEEQKEIARQRINAVLNEDQRALYRDTVIVPAKRRRDQMLKMFERGGMPGMRAFGGDRPPNGSFGFDMIDADNDGQLTRDECQRSNLPPAMILFSNFAELDSDNSGTLNRDEVREMWKRRPVPSL